MKTQTSKINRNIRRMLLVLCSIITGFLLSSCKKDDPDPPVQPMYGVPAGEILASAVNSDNSDTLSGIIPDNIISELHE
jgi:hypothetical protein